MWESATLLLDSGATQCFVDSAFATGLKQQATHTTVRLADGSEQPLSFRTNWTSKFKATSNQSHATSWTCKDNLILFLGTPGFTKTPQTSIIQQELVQFIQEASNTSSTLCKQNRQQYLMVTQVCTHSCLTPFMCDAA